MTVVGLLVRAMACLALVFGTWNPTGYHFLALIDAELPFAAKAFISAAMLLLHILFARIAWLSLGPRGVATTIVILFTGMLALAQLDVVDLASPITRDYLGLASMSLLLAAGMTWSQFRRRAIGQSDTLYQPP